MASRLVASDLEAGPGPTHRGYLDLIDIRQGVRGWAIDLADPERPVRLQLCVGGRVVAEALTDRDREDISKALKTQARAGFAFDAALLLALSTGMDDADAPVSVRLADTGQSLASDAAPPRLGAVVPMARSPAGSPADFDARVAARREAALALAAQKLATPPEHLQGCIEAVCVDPQGRLWFTGWMKRGHAQILAAVITDRDNTPACGIVISHSIPGLVAEKCGVIGLLVTSWRPVTPSAEWHLVFGTAGRFHLHAPAGIRALTPAELGGAYAAIRRHALPDVSTEPLHAMLEALVDWTPTREVARWFGVKCNVDRILLIEGLGCMVEGWAMSPMKRIEGFSLRMGEAILQADRTSLSFKPRTDLALSHPGTDAMLAHAGFVALLNGDVSHHDFAGAVLKLALEGGESVNYAVPVSAFRRFGVSAGLQDAQMFFSALPEEAFFARFAQAAIAAERAALVPPIVLSPALCRRALILVLPEDRSDLFWLFEDLAAHCAKGDITSVALVASARANRSDALWLFREFSTRIATTEKIAALLVIEDSSQGFAQLGAILTEIGAERFVFIAPGIALTGPGWTKVQAELADGADGFAFFALEGVSARCFAWSAEAFLAWASAAPAFMGGVYRDNGLAQAAVSHRSHIDAVVNLRDAASNSLRDAVNASAYARLARHAVSHREAT